jgi:hypothetical protein
VDSVGSGYGLVVRSCECRDEPSGSGAMELVSQLYVVLFLVCVDKMTGTYVVVLDVVNTPYSILILGVSYHRYTVFKCYTSWCLTCKFG